MQSTLSRKQFADGKMPSSVTLDDVVISLMALWLLRESRVERGLWF